MKHRDPVQKLPSPTGYSWGHVSHGTRDVSGTGVRSSQLLLMPLSLGLLVFCFFPWSSHFSKGSVHAPRSIHLRWAPSTLYIAMHMCTCVHISLSIPHCIWFVWMSHFWVCSRALYPNTEFFGHTSAPYSPCFCCLADAVFLDLITLIALFQQHCEEDFGAFLSAYRGPPTT